MVIGNVFIMQCLQLFLLLSFKKKIFSTTKIVYFDFSNASCHCFMYFNFNFFLRSNKHGKKKKKNTKTKSASNRGRVQLLPSPSPSRSGVKLRAGGERYRDEGDDPGRRWGTPAACRGTDGPRGRGPGRALPRVEQRDLRSLRRRDPVPFPSRSSQRNRVIATSAW